MNWTQLTSWRFTGARKAGPAAAEAIRNGRFVTLHSWLGAFPEEEARQDPGLATLKGWAVLPMNGLVLIFPDIATLIFGSAVALAGWARTGPS